MYRMWRAGRRRKSVSLSRLRRSAGAARDRREQTGPLGSRRDPDRTIQGLFPFRKRKGRSILGRGFHPLGKARRNWKTARAFRLVGEKRGGESDLVLQGQGNPCRGYTRIGVGVQQNRHGIHRQYGRLRGGIRSQGRTGDGYPGRKRASQGEVGADRHVRCQAHKGGWRLRQALLRKSQARQGQKYSFHQLRRPIQGCRIEDHRLRDMRTVELYRA